MFPITMATIGQNYKIVKVGGKDETRHFLEKLGFVAETEVSVVSTLNGNVIVNIKDSRIAVNKDMAKLIMVN